MAEQGLDRNWTLEKEKQVVESWKKSQHAVTTPADMPEQVTDQVVYRLPAGFAVEGKPQDDTIPWPEHATLVMKSAKEPGKITIARQLSRAFTFASAEEYPALRGFYQKVAAADQQPLVLTATSTARGD